MVGLIGTKQTVNSNIYKKKVDALNRNITLKSVSTPLLAPMIEEGFFNNQISEVIINKYLSEPGLSDIEALILGCTHYPLIKKQIEAFYNGSVDVLDTSEIVAADVKKYLAENNLLNNVIEPKHHFYVSDYTASFEASTRLFFGENVKLEHYPLWE